MMISEEEVCPDFDIGISGGGAQDVQHSDSEQSDSSLDNSQKEIEKDSLDPDELGEIKQLEKILNVPDNQTDDSDSTADRGSKRQRLSRSGSETSNEKEKIKKRNPRKQFYICPTEISDVFGGKISSENLCRLSAMRYGSPTVIKELIPEATVPQICGMCKL